MALRNQTQRFHDLYFFKSMADHEISHNNSIQLNQNAVRLLTMDTHDGALRDQTQIFHGLFCFKIMADHDGGSFKNSTHLD